MFQISVPALDRRNTSFLLCFPETNIAQGGVGEE